MKILVNDKYNKQKLCNDPNNECSILYSKLEILAHQIYLMKILVKDKYNIATKKIFCTDPNGGIVQYVHILCKLILLNKLARFEFCKM